MCFAGYLLRSAGSWDDLTSQEYVAIQECFLLYFADYFSHVTALIIIMFTQLACAVGAHMFTQLAMFMFTQLSMFTQLACAVGAQPFIRPRALKASQGMKPGGGLSLLWACETFTFGVI